MKKTTCIQLVLITAALAGCDRPLYQQRPDDPAMAGDQPDSTNSCPMVQSELPPDYYIWYSGLQPWDFYYGDGYRYPATIVRGGFGKRAYARVGGTGHS